VLVELRLWAGESGLWCDWAGRGEERRGEERAMRAAAHREIPPQRHGNMAVLTV